MNDATASESGSVYDVVISDPDSHHAYLNTTKGVLTGCPDDEDLRAARTRLDESRVAYLYNPDSARPRPMLLTRKRVFVGLQQIEDYIASLSVAASA